MKFGQMVMLLWNFLFLLTVEGDNTVPFLLEYTSNITGRIGSSINFTCPIKVNDVKAEEFFITWTVNGVDENMLSADTRYSNFDHNRILQVSRIRSEDAGVYKCKGVTGYGVKEAVFYVKTIDEKFCHIPMNAVRKRNYKPCFLNSLMENESQYQKVVRDIGQSVEFDCSAAGSPEPKYLWMKEKASADWIDNVTSIRQPILRINSVKLEYDGHYTCKVYNDLGQISYTYKLVIRETHSKVPKFLNSLNNVTVKAGSEAVLVGSVTCNCKPDFQWLKRQDIPVKDRKYIYMPNPKLPENSEMYSLIDSNSGDSRITIENVLKENDISVSILQIKSATVRDSGKYILYTSRGHYGMAYETVYLTVEEDNQKSSQPRLVLFIAIPIFILILCFGVLFYCWSRNNSSPRREFPKQFCGSSSVSSSSNIKSVRSNYRHSTTSGSATTGKCSNGSSVTAAKKQSSTVTENSVPLIPQQNTNISFLSGNLSQEAILLCSKGNTPSLPHFSQDTDQNPFCSQQIILPPQNMSVGSNNSHPNTHSGGSSNCSDHTNRSYSNNAKMSLSQQNQLPTVIQYPNIQNPLINGPLPPAIISSNFSPGFFAIPDPSHPYIQYSESMVPVSADYFPSRNVSSPSNTYSF